MGLKIKRRGGILAVPTTSMGDIAFLLIIFFMLTSKFMNESHVKFEHAKSPDIAALEDTPVSVILDENGEIWLQGKPCPTPEMLGQAVEILCGDQKDQKILLKIHKNLTAKQFSPVIGELAKTGRKITFVGERSAGYNM